MLILFLLDFWIFEYTYFKLVSQERVCVCWLVEYLSLPKSISLLCISSRTYTVLNKIECEGRSEEELIDLTSEVTPWKKIEDKTLGGTWQQTVQPGDWSSTQRQERHRAQSKTAGPYKKIWQTKSGPYWNKGITQQTELLKNLGDPRHRSNSSRQIWRYLAVH